LKEEENFLQNRGANAILRLRHQNIYNYVLERYGEEWMEENEWPGSFDAFIYRVKNEFPDSNSTLEFARICNPDENPLVEGTGVEYCLKIVSNYILNYGSDKKYHYDVIKTDDISKSNLYGTLKDKNLSDLTKIYGGGSIYYIFKKDLF
jgi:hypothetical protein